MSGIACWYVSKETLATLEQDGALSHRFMWQFEEDQYEYSRITAVDGLAQDHFKSWSVRMEDLDPEMDQIVILGPDEECPHRSDDRDDGAPWTSDLRVVRVLPEHVPESVETIRKMLLHPDVQFLAYWSRFARGVDRVSASPVLDPPQLVMAYATGLRTWISECPRELKDVEDIVGMPMAALDEWPGGSLEPKDFEDEPAQTTKDRRAFWLRCFPGVGLSFDSHGDACHSTGPLPSNLQLFDPDHAVRRALAARLGSKQMDRRARIGDSERSAPTFGAWLRACLERLALILHPPNVATAGAPAEVPQPGVRHLSSGGRTVGEWVLMLQPPQDRHFPASLWFPPDVQHNSTSPLSITFVFSAVESSQPASPERLKVALIAATESVQNDQAELIVCHPSVYIGQVLWKFKLPVSLFDTISQDADILFIEVSEVEDSD